jgi:hypothetical protein
MFLINASDLNGMVPHTSHRNWLDQIQDPSNRSIFDG